MKGIMRLSLMSISLGLGISYRYKKAYKNKIFSEGLRSKQVENKPQSIIADKSNTANNFCLVIKMNNSNKAQVVKATHILDLVNNISVKSNNNITFKIEEINTASNDPQIILTYNKNNIRLNLKRVLEEKHYFEEAINNITQTYSASSYSQIRDLFGFVMDDIRNNIIIIHQDYKGNIDLFRSDKTKIIVIDNNDLIKKLKLDKDKIYEYKAPRLPYKLSASSLNNFLESQKEYDLEALSYYLNHNPKGFILNFGLYRNEYTEIPSEYTYSNIEDSIKSKFYKKENIIELGSIEPKLGKEWKQSPGIDVLIYVSSYGQLKDNMLEFLLYGKF